MGRKSRNRSKRAREAGASVAGARGDESAPRLVNPRAEGTDCTHKRARVERTRADDAAVEDEDGPLSVADVEQFERDGFVLLRGAFPPDTAHACRELLWTRLERDGIRREDASSWVERHGIPGAHRIEWNRTIGHDE